MRPANYFFYGAQYYAFVGGTWYVSAGYNGPWVIVAPELVPRPILAVPVGYYRVLPLAWRAWGRDAPPRWERNWADHGEPPRASRHARRHEVGPEMVTDWRSIRDVPT